MTLSEVSARAQVSRSTASLVLQGSTRIPPDTHERVRRAMDELGYVYNRQAANLRQSRSMIVGLVVTDIRNPYFAELTMALATRLHGAEYTLFTGYSLDNLSMQEDQVSAMVQRQVDGIILLPASGTTKGSLGPLLRSSTPTVQVSRYFTDDLDYVGPDNVLASRSLAAHIASLGHGTAVMIGGPGASSARQERLDGLVAGFAGTTIDFDRDRSVVGDNNAAGGARGLADLLDGGFLPDVVVAYSDAVALGVYAEMRRRHLEPGRDIAVASFDDISLATLQSPQLTSVSTHPEKVGIAAAELLLDRMTGVERPAERVLIEPSLKPRASTALWRPRP